MSSKRVEELLGAAFGVLAHDCEPTDPGSILQRESLKERFEKVLKTRDPKATAAALAAKWQAAERELRALTGAESHPIIRCELRTRAEQLAQCRRDLLRAFGIEEK